jgi:hypothetical protein
MLSSIFLGLAVRWLTMLHAFTWEIWKILAYFIGSAVITMLILGLRNTWWIGNQRPYHVRTLLRFIHGILWALGAGIVLVFDRNDRSDRSDRLICGSSLAAVATCSWALVRWADA